MLKLTWISEKYFNNYHLFHTEIDGGSIFNEELKKLKNKLVEIYQTNKGIKKYGSSNLDHHKFIDEEELEDFVINYAYENQSVMVEAFRGFEMGMDGELMINDKLYQKFPYTGEYRLGRIKNELHQYQATIIEYKIHRQGKWELEINAEYDHKKLTWDSHKCRILYGDQEFTRIDEGECRSRSFFIPIIGTIYDGVRIKDNGELDFDENNINYSWDLIPTNNDI